MKLEDMPELTSLIIVQRSFDIPGKLQNLVGYYRGISESEGKIMVVLAPEMSTIGGGSGWHADKTYKIPIEKITQIEVLKTDYIKK
ncbi:hypothetical protein JW756_00195 [Candidatus Woesearchaeota archaeon]|nr:hypothetical protein [Candidatus Woesearchaeota archaeon]